MCANRWTHSSTPTAVLLGIDGLLAGGPVVGTDDVVAFIDDIYESLHGKDRPSRSNRARAARLTVQRAGYARGAIRASTRIGPKRYSAARRRASSRRAPRSSVERTIAPSHAALRATCQPRGTEVLAQVSLL